MIQLGPPDATVPPDLLDRPGAFAWWYVDLLDGAGNGAVCIWSYGLPFLPGLAAGARAGRPEAPIRRPSLNLALYRQGRLACYLLQEYGADHDPGPEPLGTDIRLGDSTCRSWEEAGRRRVRVELDCPVPGSAERLTGTLQLEGPACRWEAGSAGEPADHLWTPLSAPARAELSVQLGSGAPIRVEGRGYHDRNFGARPLHGLGIGRWIWHRFALREEELISYLHWPRSGEGAPRHLLLRVAPDGRVEPLGEPEVELEEERGTGAGLRLPRLIRLRTPDGARYEIRNRAPVDIGPFYLRFAAEVVTPSGEVAPGWGELCVPDRVDLPLHRPFVRMRVHRPGGPNSLWAPLFSGPRAGRLARLARQWAGS